MTDELRAKFEAFVIEQYDAGKLPISIEFYDPCWKVWQGAHASRNAEVVSLEIERDVAKAAYTSLRSEAEALQAKVRWMHQYEKGLNRRAEVEEVLFEVARGKRPPLSADECRKLAIKLGVPEKDS